MKDESKPTNAELRENALKGWQTLDDKFKLNHPLWATITRRAFEMNMSQEERFKLLLVNFAKQNMELTMHLNNAGETIQAKDKEIADLKEQIEQLKPLSE